MTLVIGGGRSGRAVCQLLQEQGQAVWVFDDRLDTLSYSVSRWTRLDALPTVSTVIVSPGVPATHPLVQLARGVGLPVRGECAFGLQALQPSWKAGITGTNGKTTVTEMASWLLMQRDPTTLAAGNIGLPLSEVARQPPAQQPRTLILELSSYQLEDLEGDWLDAAVWLNLTPDHLDRYGNMHAYAAAKARIGRCLKHQGELLVREDVLQDWSDLLQDCQTRLRTFGSASTDLFWRQDVLYWQGQPVGEMRLQGLMPHDQENLAAAAWIAHRAGMPWQEALERAPSFRKGPHRCEEVAVIRGVHWINDSKGTNLDAVLKASEAFPARQILIAGGVHKGAAYTPWIEGLKGRVERILAIGEAASCLAKDLGSHFPVECCGTLEAAVTRAAELAATGDVVLLSPGCASFDQFRDYAHRGETFRSSVLQLARTSDTVKTVGS